MASKPLPAFPDAELPGAETIYEIYVGSGDGFELQDVSGHREAALAIARRLAARPGALVRVMCESYDPARDETIERIVFDSSALDPLRRPAGSWSDAGSRPPSEPEPLPKLVVVFGGLTIAMALAAAGMAVF